MENILTIIIVTKNRPEFLNRLLQYFVKTHCRHWIYIADSSDASHIEQTRQIVKELEDPLNILYKECPGMTVSGCHRELAQLISTPYMVCVADGAFLITPSLDQCVQFLENNPDYAIAHGVAALFTLDNEDKPYGSFASVCSYSLPRVEQKTAAERLSYHLSHYTVSMYCVMRTSVWLACWIDTKPVKNPAIAGELLPCCLSVVHGKAKQLDCLYLVRHMHSRRSSLPATVYDWITSGDWSSVYQVFSRALAETVALQDHIEPNEAYRIVKRAFYPYILGRLTKSGGAKKRPFPHNTKTILKRIPGVKHWVVPWWRLAKANIHKKELSLPALLKPNAPYHSDFIEIYKIVSEG